MKNQLAKYLTQALVSFVIALGIILSAVIVTNGIIKVKDQNTITITGSAKQQIKSDLAKWSGSFSTQSTRLDDAYNLLNSNTLKVKNYLKTKGFSEKDIIFSSINTITNYEILPSGMRSNRVESYLLTQNVEISSSDVDKITAISREATELINQGIEFRSNQPQYFYTKIADLKVNMLAKATKDARERALKVAENTNAKIGALRSASMGVFQITSLYSTEISDYGINDTSSVDKEITAVVNCNFEIRAK